MSSNCDSLPVEHTPEANVASNHTLAQTTYQNHNQHVQMWRAREDAKMIRRLAAKLGPLPSPGDPDFQVVDLHLLDAHLRELMGVVPIRSIEEVNALIAQFHPIQR